jgi:Ca2+/Na+ antiporter
VQTLESLFHTLGSSPLFVMVAVLLLFVLLLSAVLRLARLALVVFVLLLAYVGYLHTVGDDVPRSVRVAEQVFKESARDAGTALKENAEAAGEAVRTAAENVGEHLEQGFAGSARAQESPSPADVTAESDSGGWTPPVDRRDPPPSPPRKLD